MKKKPKYKHEEKNATQLIIEHYENFIPEIPEVMPLWHKSISPLTETYNISTKKNIKHVSFYHDYINSVISLILQDFIFNKNACFIGKTGERDTLTIPGQKRLAEVVTAYLYLPLMTNILYDFNQDYKDKEDTFFVYHVSTAELLAVFNSLNLWVGSFDEEMKRFEATLVKNLLKSNPGLFSYLAYDKTSYLKLGKCSFNLENCSKDLCITFSFNPKEACQKIQKVAKNSRFQEEIVLNFTEGPVEF